MGKVAGSPFLVYAASTVTLGAFQSNDAGRTLAISGYRKPVVAASR